MGVVEGSLQVGGGLPGVSERDRCGVGLLQLLLLRLVLISGVRGSTVGRLPGEGHRSSIFLYYIECSLFCIYIDHSRRLILW